MKITPIILAAGQGTRMRSKRPKVLHEIGGLPMLQHVINSCRSLEAETICVVYGHGGELVRKSIAGDDLYWALQAEQKGTGHAVAQAINQAPNDSIVVVAYGDVPLIRSETLRQLALQINDADCCVLTTTLAQPKGYGRIVRNNTGHVTAIVEEKDANDKIRKIQEVNTGFIAAKADKLKTWLKQISNDNAQGEYYLTDCIAIAVNEGGTVTALNCDDSTEVEGVNNRQQLARLERVYQRQLADALLLAGATLADPDRLDIRGTLETGQDVFIDVNVVFEGTVTLGDNVSIAPNCVIKNATIGSGSHIHPNSVIEDSSIGESCNVGPFARLRPQTELADKAKVGNFVEIKKAQIGYGSKVSHLSYVGDTTMGKDVNIGAGTITCNYDGANKHQTVIGDNAFIGSNSALVAPVNIGAGATIGAGSTIIRDAAEGTLTLTRATQRTIESWQRPVKKKK